ncbi:MAG: hypothetical protein NWF01_06505 [Candidatus Bathyarchaeota archaeon]|nr:hypothetical protein [Candidatus Bathyarchaeota archaeon]
MKLKSAMVLLTTLSVIAYCLFMAYFLECSLHDSYTTLAMLTIFNLLFVPIFFQFKGSLNLKLGILAVGNFFGLFWNYFFNSFFLYIGGETAVYHVSYVLFFPFLNIIWFVTFWSLSLTVLSSRLNKNRVVP